MLARRWLTPRRLTSGTTTVGPVTITRLAEVIAARPSSPVTAHRQAAVPNHVMITPVLSSRRITCGASR